MTVLEEIADKFIEDILGAYPIMLYSLDYELREFLPTIKDRKYSESLKQIVDEDSKAMESSGEVTANELAGAFLNAYDLPEYVNEEILLTEMMQEYFQTISAGGRTLLSELIQLVMKSDRVGVRIMRELEEAEQEDDYMPNVWTYHKKWKTKDVVKYVLEFYDSTRQEVDIEEKDDIY